MTIDLKWGLPIVLPFVWVLLARVLCLVASLNWTDSIAYFVLLLYIVVGLPFSIFTPLTLQDNGVKWNMTIGKQK